MGVITPLLFALRDMLPQFLHNCAVRCDLALLTNGDTASATVAKEQEALPLAQDAKVLFLNFLLLCN